ncbi:NUDIX domain-containing protein [Flavobacteriaceae bacterium F89]|uniref:NUDIX domain-containing protein n=1 Tax=Cerina litoralis TaxID=2874477 RepID=A0AAE3EST2_9FLAO|nr:NUDIX domain-containing protein [Cerina litoralis]MCG2459489.1 NUDIX domain-containing protein [Cerina litoralis]
MAQFTKETIALIREELKKCIPQLSINCVIFRFDGEALQIPVVQPMNADAWSIPGGYVYQKEGIHDAAKRILFEQTQMDNLILSQFGTFGSAEREFSKEISGHTNLGFPKDIIDWISQRFVTIGYYSIVQLKKSKLKPGLFFKEVKWIDINDADKLALDHSVLVSEAVQTLRAELQSRPLLSSFMPETFTLPELQKLYEAILGRPVDRGNFRQRMLKSNILIKIGPTREKTKNRPPILYRLDHKVYLDSLTHDIKYGF